MANGNSQVPVIAAVAGMVPTVTTVQETVMNDAPANVHSTVEGDLAAGSGRSVTEDKNNENIANSETITTFKCVRNLGVVFDCVFHMENHITSVCQSCYFHLRNIGSIRRLSR